MISRNYKEGHCMRCFGDYINMEISFILRDKLKTSKCTWYCGEGFF